MNRRAAISWPIVRRRVTADLLDLLALLTEFLATGGRTFGWNRSAPSETALYGAIYRLRKQGLLVRHPVNGNPATLTLTEAGRQQVSAELFPERFWRQRWDGRWYTLMYDVPERERRYRNALNAFLHRMRMGALQKSVFVSVRDVRPFYQDLLDTAALADYAVLFESRTVRGEDSRAVAARAWNLEGLRDVQAAYLEGCGQRDAQEAPCGAAGALAAMRAELAAYRRAMEADPLLPGVLLPADYLGRDAAAAVRRRVARLARAGLPF